MNFFRKFIIGVCMCSLGSIGFDGSFPRTGGIGALACDDNSRVIVYLFDLARNKAAGLGFID